MNINEFDQQFAESYYEKQERWKKIKAKRRSEGKCWQCAKLLNDCECANLTRNQHLEDQKKRV